MDSEKLFDLSGKLALITGASRGIGAEAAKTLARFGARVILSSRKREGLDGIAQEITEEGFEATVRPCHNGDLSQINSLFEELDREGESVDILVNNVGGTVGAGGPGEPRGGGGRLAAALAPPSQIFSFLLKNKKRQKIKNK